MSRNEIVTESDLITAVEDALKRRYVYNKIKAQIRAEVFHVLEDKTVSPPEKPADMFLVAELIKEFLIKMKLENTLSVFCEELGHHSDLGVDRTFIGTELGLNTIGCEESIPLLLLVTQYLKRNREEYLKSAIGQLDIASSVASHQGGIPSTNSTSSVADTIQSTVSSSKPSSISQTSKNELTRIHPISPSMQLDDNSSYHNERFEDDSIAT